MRFASGGSAGVVALRVMSFPLVLFSDSPLGGSLDVGNLDQGRQSVCDFPWEA